VDFELWFVRKVNYGEAIGPTPRVDVTWTGSKRERRGHGAEHVTVADHAAFGPSRGKDQRKVIGFI